MSARRKLSDAQLMWVRAISRKRRDLYRQLQSLPTNAEIARELDCTEQWIEKVISEKFRKIVPRETNSECRVKPNNKLVEVITWKS